MPQLNYFISPTGVGIITGLSTDAKPSEVPDNWYFVEIDTGITYSSRYNQWIANPSGGGGGDMYKSENLSGLTNYTTARSNLGLGSLATQNGTFSGTSSGTNTGDETASTIGVLINGSSAATPNDTDLVATAETSVLKKITWTNVKAFLKSYFDTLYQVAGSYLTSANISDTAYDATSWDGVTTIAPSKNAVRDKFVSIDSDVAGKQASLGFTPENVSNKSTTTSLGTSDTLYPSQNAVKSYVDTGLGTKQNTLTNPVTGTGTLNELTYWSGANTVGTLATATYPSLTELSYVKNVTSAIQTQLNGKQASLTNPVTGTGTNNEIAAFNSTGSTITSLTTATYPSLTELSYVKGVTSALQTQLNGKEPTISNGFGITGTTTKAVSLTTAQAFCTATTSISAATYADITGASITLAAGTWLIIGQVYGYAANAAIQLNAAITDSANAIITEGTAGAPASGGASVNQWTCVSLSAIVTPSGSTTYKLRGARGNTTITATITVADGSGQGVSNNASSNTDKGTGIRAIRVA